MLRKDLTSHQIADLSQLLGHDLSAAELAHYNAHHSDEAGYFALDDRPRDGRKFLLIYMGCWSKGIDHYMRTYRPELMDEYWVIRIVDYALVLHCIRDKNFPEPELLKVAWQKADAIIYAPVGAIYQNFGSEHLLKYVRPETKTAAFSSAHQGCWWPICPIGDDGVIKRLEEGDTPEQIWDSFQVGNFDPCFEKRYAAQMAFSKGKQSFGSIPLTEFIERNYRTNKLFFTYNHPTYNVLAFCADASFGVLGHPVKGDDHCLALPPDAFLRSEIYPETHYEWEYFKFSYPMRWKHELGGSEFYRKEIYEAFERWKKSKA